MSHWSRQLKGFVKKKCKGVLTISFCEAGSKRKAAAIKKSMEEMQSRIADLNKIIKRLYEDNVLGKITDARFMELSQDYEAEDTGSGRKQQIDIYYSFIGKVDLPEE